MINTLFLTLQLSNLLLLLSFIQHSQTYIHGLLCQSFKLKNSELKTTHNIGIVVCTFSDNFSRNSCISKVSLSPGGYSQEFLVGVCHPVLQLLSLFQTKKCHFPNPFSDLAFAKIMLSLLRFQRKQKKLFKSISNSHISLSFLLIWNKNDKYVYTVPQFPRKPYPISDQNGQSVYPFSDQNTQRDRAAHTYIAYIREYPLPRVIKSLPQKGHRNKGLEESSKT